MSCMFMGSKLDKDISEWDVSKVEDMNHMFFRSYLTCDLSKWTPYALNRIDCMFEESKLKKPYWEQCYNKEEMLKAIKAHQLYFSLEEDLKKCSNQDKKYKL